jgi:NlpC/P60 family putative phage cell wall peptidase
MTATPSSTELREQIVAEARRWIGTPYRHQASLRGVGCDCVGMVAGIWSSVFGEAPGMPQAYSSGWLDPSPEETLLALARRHMAERQPHAFEPGDMLVFRWVDRMPARHCGIAVSETRMVHAYQSAGKVAEGELHRQWRQRIAGVFAFPAVEEAR